MLYMLSYDTIGTIISISKYKKLKMIPLESYLDRLLYSKELATIKSTLSFYGFNLLNHKYTIIDYDNKEFERHSAYITISKEIKKYKRFDEISEILNDKTCT